MKYDIDTNYTIAVGLAPAAVAPGTDAGAAINHALAPCAALVINAACAAWSSGSVTMKTQYSDDNSSWSDDDGSSGNDYTTSLTANGMATLNVPNPLGQYSRAYITVGTATVTCGIVNISGPLRRVAVS